jgi:hypothetical protein
MVPYMLLELKLAAVEECGPGIEGQRKGEGLCSRLNDHRGWSQCDAGVGAGAFGASLNIIRMI